MVSKCSICNSEELWVADVVDSEENQFQEYKYLCRDCYHDVITRRNDSLRKANENMEAYKIQKEQEANKWKEKIINLPLEL